jgi:hypothetical protein
MKKNERNKKILGLHPCPWQTFKSVDESIDKYCLRNILAVAEL